MTSLVNQIRARLKRPEVWKCVGFASAIVGLLCYALSSSFNSLFGKWKLWKAFLYFVFSFIICFVVFFFAKGSQRSSRLRSKAHMAVLFLTITSFYPFFFDKAVTKKPDAYSVVSCAAFAVMSLSLSRLTTDSGSEVDLLKFFLAALIIQLMKINWLLGIVGAGFSYSLITLPSYLEALPDESGRRPQDQPAGDIEAGYPQLQSNASSVSASAVLQQEANRDNANINLYEPLLSAEVDSHSQEVSVDVALNEVGSQQLRSDANNAGALVVTPQGNTASNQTNRSDGAFPSFSGQDNPGSFAGYLYQALPRRGPRREILETFHAGRSLCHYLSKHLKTLQDKTLQDTSHSLPCDFCEDLLSRILKSFTKSLEILQTGYSFADSNSLTGVASKCVKRSLKPRHSFTHGENKARQKGLGLIHRRRHR